MTEDSIGDRVVELSEAFEAHHSVRESGAWGSRDLGNWQYVAVVAEEVDDVRDIANEYGFVEDSPPDELQVKSSYQKCSEVAEDDDLTLLVFRDE